MNRAVATAVLAGFAAVMMAGLLLRPLLPLDETRYLAVAWEMWLNGDYLVPSKNFEVYSQKPPLLFWLINLAWAVTGVAEFSARLVGPAFGVATVALTGLLARRLWPDDPGAAVRAMLALSGMSLFAVSAGLTMFDAMLAAWVVAAMIALVTAARTGNRRWWVVVGICVGLGVLTKGPVVLLHVVPAVLGMHFWLRHDAHPVAVSRKRLAAGGGIALAAALAVAALWLVPALLTSGPEYREAILWRQTAGRVVTSFAHAQPWWFFVAILPALLFPWLWVPALWRAAWRDGWRDPGLRLGLVWGGAALVLFSLVSGKQAHYLIPEMPAAALIVARLLRDRTSVSLAPALLPAIALGLGMLALAVGVVPRNEVTTMLEPRLAMLPLALVLGAICWLAWRRGGLAGGAVLGLGMMLVVNLIIATTQLRDIYNSTPIARRIAAFEDAGIAYPRSYHAQFNFAARLTRPVDTPRAPEALSSWIGVHPNGAIVAKIADHPVDWPAHETITFRGSPYGIWHVAEATQDGEQQ